MIIIPPTASARRAERTMICLERLIADSTKPETMRRHAALRLGRLRAAAKTSKPAAPPPATTRATPPPSAQACFEAVESFRALSLQRSALFRKRRTTGEQEIFKAMLALMPAAAPTNDDPKAWTNFVAQVSGLLEEIKAVKVL